MADLARAVLRRAPEKFALAGLSMGGYVAMEIMRQEPDRVIKLALLDTSARPDTPEITARRLALMEEAELGEFRGVTAKLLPNLVHPSHVNAPGVRDVIFEMAERVGKLSFMRQQNAIMNRLDSRPFLKDIGCPTLVLCGESDQLAPPEVHREIADMIGDNAHLVVVPESGHLTPLEEPDAVNRAMHEWLLAA